jgi:hypothetical protein
MRFRKLRIAWSVGCGIACVLLIVLWVRSYWWWDSFTSPAMISNGVGVCSVQGLVCFHAKTQPMRMRWYVDPNSESIAASFNEIRRTKTFAGVGVSRFANQSVLLVSHWFLAFLFAAVGIVPWLSFRFGLRTLLIATTLIAVVLGLIVWLSS